jgi:Tannase-like family of unknown function (DUF6351)
VASVVLLGVLAAHDVDVDVLSSRADQVSEGDALLRVEGRRLQDLRVLPNGADVTDAFEREGRALVGLVDGLRLGRNRISVYDRWRRVASERLTNHPIEGPIFSGPRQKPFVCKTNQPAVGLGEPLVDNQEGDGFRVLAPDGSTAGWRRNCRVNRRVEWLYPPAALDLADRGRRPCARRRLRLVEADRRRARAARRDLPDRGLRLHEAGRRSSF